MKTGWNQARRQRQAELIRNWKPWEHSTGPLSESGKARVSQNGFKGAPRAEQSKLAKVLRAQRKFLGECLKYRLSN